VSVDVTASIRSLLGQHGVTFREVAHEPTPTSEEAAKARGEPLEVGAKSLVMKTGPSWSLFVIPANEKIDSAAVRRHLQLRHLRFATSDELFHLTGLVPGSVPPFGEPVLPVQLYADPSLGGGTGRIAFNAGSLTLSFILKVDDWRRIASPHLLDLVGRRA
jgi:prolyl-tRNA editing enzyme YbaK/EbsC (Cys-tRNA(Pro) deacylase)